MPRILAFRRFGATLAMLIGFVWLSAITGSVRSAPQLLMPPTNQVSDAERQAIRRWLDEDWVRGPETEQRSRQDYEATGIQHPWQGLAYAINRIRHNRIDQAVSLTVALNQKYPDNLDGWFLTAWMHVLTDRYESALLDLQSLDAARQRQPDLPPPAAKLLARRMGRLIGYLEGPVRDRVNADLLQSTTQQLTQGLAAETLPIFDEQRREVAEVFSELVRQQEADRQQELAKIGLQDQQETKALEQANVLLEETESRLQPRRDEVRAAGQRQIAELEQQASDALAERQSVVSAIYDTEQNLAFLYADWNAILQQPPRFRVGLGYLQNQIRETEFELSRLRSNGNLLANQVASLRNEIRLSRWSYASQLKEIEREINDAARLRRRNLGKLNRLAGGPEMPDGKQSALQNRRTALKTYDDLSIEAYRRQILDAIQ